MCLARCDNKMTSYGRQLEDYNFGYITGEFVCKVCDAEFTYTYVINEDIPGGKIINKPAIQEICLCRPCLDIWKVDNHAYQPEED